MASLRHTCAIIILSNLHLDMPHLWGGWIISAKEKCSLTKIYTDLWTIFETNGPFVYIEKVIDLWVQIMKNGGKNKSVAFIILFSIYIYTDTNPPATLLGSNKWDIFRMGRLVRDDSKATVTQITTCYNQGMQNTISECTTRRTLKQMGYSSRRPHRVPLLSAKNRKRRLQFDRLTKIGQWKIEKTLPGLMSIDFCCYIQMVRSEFGVKNMKAWIHPALSQRFRLVVVV